MKRETQTWIFVIIIIGLIVGVVLCFIPKKKPLDYFTITTGSLPSGTVLSTVITNTVIDCARKALEENSNGFGWEVSGKCRLYGDDVTCVEKGTCGGIVSGCR
jgi:hypothetical protein